MQLNSIHFFHTNGQNSEGHYWNFRGEMTVITE